jgi:hypothetical protein
MLSGDEPHERCDARVEQFVGQTLMLQSLPDADGYALVGRSGGTSPMVGRIGSTTTRAEVAVAAFDGRWRMSLARRGLTWRLVAAGADNQTVATYQPSWLRRGGRIWAAPDRWGALRPRSILALDPTWKLTLQGNELLRIRDLWRAWRKGEDQLRLEVALTPTTIQPPGLSLVTLLGCWAVLVNDDLSVGVSDGGGASL